jgi:hypothetical protein
MKALHLSLFLLCSLPAAFAPAAPVVLIENGEARCVIRVPERLLDDRAKNPEPPSVWKGTPSAETKRRRLRESVFDFAAVLERLSGTKIEIVPGPPAPADQRMPILIGEVAEAVYGKPKESHPEGQGLRIVAGPKGVGLIGESDLGTSYAIYTLLDQLGCRWFMPGEIGEVLPASKIVTVAEQDLSTGPRTAYRGLWYADNDFGRRNRLGGLEINAGHALESMVPEKLRETNPEIRAIIKGQPHKHLVQWTHPLVADAIAANVLERLAKNPELKSVSLSPSDGAEWDESGDTKYDAGDFDTTLQTVAKSDRLIVLCNRVAEKVTAKHPDVLFGVLAYVDYTRPPVREKLHPNVIPQIAPITFSRSHPMTAPEPNNESLRYLVEGWGKATKRASYYLYGFNLAEPAAPQPFMTKWGTDLPIIYRNGCAFWQPETITNFETAMHMHWLGLRMAWNPDQKPGEIFDELHQFFYGAAAAEMAAYWQFIDRIWIDTPEYSGAGFGHLRRFTPERMAGARKLIDAATAKASSPMEKARVSVAEASFAQHERFIRLRRDLAEGRFENLAADAKTYFDRTTELGEKHKAIASFGQMGWTRGNSLYGTYFRAFYQKTYDDASRVAKDFEIVTNPPLRKWHHAADPDKKGEAAGWGGADFDDAKWPVTDVGTETWSTIGHHNYMGSLWYRTTVKLPAKTDGKTFLWIGSTDGRVKVFVNGRHLPYVDAKGVAADSFSGFCQPVSFDISEAIQPGAENNIALFCTREMVNELGTGGLLAPAVIYREKK